MRTTSVKESEIKRKWYLVDAAGVPLGRLAAQVAQVLRGKHKPLFEYHLDCGDYVVVINADKVVLTGRKKDELVHWHTMEIDGLRSASRGKLLAENPARAVEKAIWGMIPKTRLGRHIFGKLNVYAGSKHPHESQSPEPLKITKD